MVSNIFYLGKISNLTHIFQMGWFNHQLLYILTINILCKPDWHESFHLGHQTPLGATRTIPTCNGCRLSAISQWKSELWAGGSFFKWWCCWSAVRMLHADNTHMWCHWCHYILVQVFWMFLVHQLHIVVKGISILRCRLKFQALHGTSSMLDIPQFIESHVFSVYFPWDQDFGSILKRF